MARIYLAGAESIELFRALIDNDTMDIMLSFFYVQQRGAMPQIMKLLKHHPDVRVYLDSGAKAFIKKDRGDPQMYWKAYYDLLKEHGHRFEYASEFDVEGYTWENAKGKQRTISREQVEVWRDDLHELGTVAIVPVWHADHGGEAWMKLVQDPRFLHLAIGDAGISTGGGDARISKGGDARISRGEVGKLISQAHTWNKTVHGYGEVASVDDLPLTRFDTIASATWLVGQRFGDLCIFQSGHYKRISASGKTGKRERKKYRKYFEHLGIDPAKIEQDDRQEVNKANIIAWNNLSKRLQLVHAHKGPQRPTVAPESTQEPSATVSPLPFVRPSGSGIGQSLERSQGMESITVEKTEETAISLPVAKPFMPKTTPPLMCAQCVMKLDCPKYQDTAVCAFREEFAQVSTRDANEVVEELASIFQVNVERARYLRLWEQIQGGGMIHGEVTKHFEQTFQMGAKLAELMKGKKSTRATALGAGIVDKLFAGLGGESVKVITEQDEEHALPAGDEEDISEKNSLTDQQKKQLASTSHST